MPVERLLIGFIRASQKVEAGCSSGAFRSEFRHQLRGLMMEDILASMQREDRAHIAGIGNDGEYLWSATT